MNDIIKKFDHEKLIGFCREKLIDLVLLFGSSVSDWTHTQSDIDLAVLPNHECKNIDILDVILHLEQIFKRPVDVVMLQSSVEPLLLYEIFTHGKILYEANDWVYTGQFFRAWSLYQDTIHLREAEHQYLYHT